MGKRSKEPFFWAMFSSGGMLAALGLPALAGLLWFAFPLSWIAPPSHALLVDKIEPPWIRLGLFVVLSLAFFHWGHRFRFTLYDGLQLSHLYGLIATVCYGGAAALSLAAGYLLWTFG